MRKGGPSDGLKKVTGKGKIKKEVNKMKKIRSSLVVILMVVLFVCSTFAVQAKTVTGTFSDGTYGITLSKRSSTNIAASISVTIEEPSAPSVWVYQTGTVIGSQETRSLDASGFNGCYREQTLSNIISASCTYTVGSERAARTGVYSVL